MPADGSILSSSSPPSRRRLAGWSLIVAMSLLAGVLLLRHPVHSLLVRACFQDVNGLKAAAFVRIAGVEVGRVKTVRAQPTNSTCPAAVEMELRTDYPLSLPSDAVASVNSEGLLGSLYVAIDATHTSDLPVANGGQIQSRENTPVTAASVVRALNDIDKTVKDKLDERRGSADHPHDMPGTEKLSPKQH